MANVIKSTDSNFQSTVRTLLAEGKAKVTFVKKDGSLRTLTGTTQAGVVPASTGAGRTPAAGVQTVYDLDLGEWRSFRWDSVQSVEAIDG